jgi:hypothetical protein
MGASAVSGPRNVSIGALPSIVRVAYARFGSPRCPHRSFARGKPSPENSCAIRRRLR